MHLLKQSRRINVLFWSNMLNILAVSAFTLDAKWNFSCLCSVVGLKFLDIPYHSVSEQFKSFIIWCFSTLCTLKWIACVEVFAHHSHSGALIPRLNIYIYTFAVPSNMLFPFLTVKVASRGNLLTIFLKFPV